MSSSEDSMADFEPGPPKRLKPCATHCPDGASLKVGETYDSLEALTSAVKMYQKQDCNVYYKRDTTTVKMARKKGLKRSIKQTLEYYSIKYCCIHGGKHFKSKSKGVRSSSTFQKSCGAFFQVGINQSGDKYVVTATHFVHNHRSTKKLYEHLPQVRSLDATEKAKVASLLKLGANKKKVRDEIAAQTAKVVLLKDLSNIVVCRDSLDRNNLEDTITRLKEKYGAECHVLEENGIFKGLYFVTQNMKRSMAAFPQFIGIDATYKLLNIRAPVYLMVAEDSQGCTEIVAVSILVNEDADSMTWFLEMFKQSHPSWTDIRCFMADKDLLERNVIKQQFPSANVLICVFHSLRTFNREITCDKLGITPLQRDSAKEIFQRMVYASTEEEYMREYEKLKALPTSISTYFNRNWHDIRDEWTLSSNFMQSNFLNTTNNRIESLNAKIKSVVKLYSTLEEFIESFFVLVACLDGERDHKAAYSYQKTRIDAFDTSSPEAFYSDLLTQYAFNFVKRELSQKNRGQIAATEKDDVFSFEKDGFRVCETSCDFCSCPSFAAMSLPCRLPRQSLSLFH